MAWQEETKSVFITNKCKGLIVRLKKEPDMFIGLEGSHRPPMSSQYLAISSTVQRQEEAPSSLS